MCLSLLDFPSGFGPNPWALSYIMAMHGEARVLILDNLTIGVTP
jgi:hypothetical protein